MENNVEDSKALVLYGYVWKKWQIHRKECRLVRVPIKSNKISNPSIEFTIAIFSLLLGSLCYPKFGSKPIGNVICYCLPWFIWSYFKEIISRRQELPIAGKIPSRRKIRNNFSIPPLLKQKILFGGCRYKFSELALFNELLTLQYNLFTAYSYRPTKFCDRLCYAWCCFLQNLHQIADEDRVDWTLAS